jgi:hypothetical protein
MRKVGQEHLVIPTMAVETATDSLEAGIDPSTEGEEAGSISESLLSSDPDSYSAGPSLESTNGN